MPPAPSPLPSPDALHSLISHNPALFYVVVVSCCICLVCGTTYVLSKAVNSWNSQTVDRLTNKIPPEDQAEQSAQCIDVEDSWMRKLQIRLARGPSKSKRDSPVFSPDRPAVRNWAAHHVARCRDVDVSAMPVPAVSTTVTNGYMSLDSEPVLPAPPINLVGLGLGNVCFAPESRDAPSSGFTEHATEEDNALDEKDIVDNSLSIYSEASVDRFSPYVPVYDEELQTGQLGSIFTIGSPDSSAPAHRTEVAANCSVSSLAYLRPSSTLNISVDPFNEATGTDQLVDGVSNYDLSNNQSAAGQASWHKQDIQ